MLLSRMCFRLGCYRSSKHPPRCTYGISERNNGCHSQGPNRTTMYVSYNQPDPRSSGTGLRFRPTASPKQPAGVWRKGLNRRARHDVMHLTPTIVSQYNTMSVVVLIMPTQHAVCQSPGVPCYWSICCLCLCHCSYS
jgi:hypothetical protein